MSDEWPIRQTLLIRANTQNDYKVSDEFEAHWRALPPVTQLSDPYTIFNHICIKHRTEAAHLRPAVFHPFKKYILKNRWSAFNVIRTGDYF